MERKAKEGAIPTERKRRETTENMVINSKVETINGFAMNELLCD